MKRPEVIMHNSVSLDGRINGFKADEGLHYGIVASYHADVYMAGSNTARTGLELYGAVPPETGTDFQKPVKDSHLSYWVIPDSRGVLKGFLHAYRNMEYCRDVMVLISSKTPHAYVNYLTERHYDFLVCGNDYVDYVQAFQTLAVQYNMKRILVDSGPALGGILLKNGLVDEISLLIYPYLVGNKVPGLFEKLDIEKVNIELQLLKNETLASGHIRTVWKVVKNSRVTGKNQGHSA